MYRASTNETATRRMKAAGALSYAWPTVSASGNVPASQ
jgi:hypothetical protein